MSKFYKIHPAIGVARLGNSPGTAEGVNFFHGPEIPGVPALAAGEKYRDANGLLKRQGARFRVYEYDTANPAAEPKEIIVGGQVTGIEWRAHLANKKAFWFAFNGQDGENGYAPNHPLRNGSLQEPLDQRRAKYVIDFGSRTLSAPSTAVDFSKGTGAGQPETSPGPLQPNVAGQNLEITYLGTMLTDGAGRLTILGGLGISGARTAQALQRFQTNAHYANNAEWFDDVSDGPVEARVIFADGSSAPAAPAWVMVGPPDFAPSVENIVTMRDAIHDTAVRALGHAPALFHDGMFRNDYRPSFTREVFPILRRVARYRAVIRSATSHHRWDRQEVYAAYARHPFQPPQGIGGVPTPANLFHRVRPVGLQGNSIFDEDPPLMPQLFGDRGAASALVLTRTQQHILLQWSQGLFGQDWVGFPQPAATLTPEGLDRAALDACVGGAFFPGIEAGWILRRSSVYATPFEFRFKPPVTDEFDLDNLTPGSVTMRSALPWQSDFLQCDDNWWPAARPNQVLRNGASRDWDFGIGSEFEMVLNWDKMGVVREPTDGQFTEDERTLVVHLA